MARFAYVWLVMLLGCCSRGGVASSSRGPSAIAHEKIVRDVHSQSNPQAVQTRHLDLEWALDFDARRVEGRATWSVVRHDPTAPLILDTRALEIGAVETARNPGAAGEAVSDKEQIQWSTTTWAVGTSDPILGAPLRIDLPAGADLVRIAYRTTPTASGLQWLGSEQTADRAQPFLYSQAEAIHARSFLPCQDSPAVRITFDAAIEAKKPLSVLMAAQRVAARAGDPPELHRFRMPEAIPSYLVAFAAGQLEFVTLGTRSGVWAEPSMLARAADEFADVESMIAIVEALYGPYRWERYELLVLPPAFPFGGMENPRLTFVTPTILAGDRSLVALIAHELAHSWSGNLVTNATWHDLWLNEGFTVYIERRIVEVLYGRARAEMEATLGRQSLESELSELSPSLRRLVPSLAGRDPDDGLTEVAYEKGALFLRALEEAYGRDAFDAVLRRWFDEHAFSSQTTAAFEAFLAAQLAGIPTLEGREAPDADLWIRGVGLPDDAPRSDPQVFASVDRAVAMFAGHGDPKALSTTDWNPHQWLHFLRAIAGSTHVTQMASLDARFGFTASTNAEILAQWLDMGIRHGYRAIDPRLETFLAQVGRRKFLLPLYRALLESDRSADARRIYAQDRAGYHPITQTSLDALLLRGSTSGASAGTDPA